MTEERGSKTFYRDVYSFTDRIRDVALFKGELVVKVNIHSCLRGSALEWYTIELTQEEKKRLRDSSMEEGWSSALTARFKPQTAEALNELQDLRNARSANVGDVYNQITMAWNKLEGGLRVHIPEPTPHTTVAESLDQLDAKYGIWKDMTKDRDRKMKDPKTKLPSGRRSSQVTLVMIRKIVGTNVAVPNEMTESHGTNGEALRSTAASAAATNRPSLPGRRDGSRVLRLSGVLVRPSSSDAVRTIWLDPGAPIWRMLRKCGRRTVEPYQEDFAETESSDDKAEQSDADSDSSTEPEGDQALLAKVHTVAGTCRSMREGSLHLGMLCLIIWRPAKRRKWLLPLMHCWPTSMTF